MPSAGIPPKFCIKIFCYLCAMQVILRFGKLLLSNFYVGSSTIFLIWITFFDGNDLIGLTRNHLKLMETETEIQFYKDKIDLVIAEKAYLNGSNDAIERFAREKFLMRKEHEDVFLVEPAPNTSILGRLTSK